MRELAGRNRLTAGWDFAVFVPYGINHSIKSGVFDNFCYLPLKNKQIVLEEAK